MLWRWAVAARISVDTNDSTSDASTTRRASRATNDTSDTCETTHAGVVLHRRYAASIVEAFKLFEELILGNFAPVDFEPVSDRLRPLAFVALCERLQLLDSFSFLRYRLHVRFCFLANARAVPLAKGCGVRLSRFHALRFVAE